MKTAATWFLGFAILVAVVWQPSQVAKAQNPAITPLQYTFSSSAAVHTDCAVTAGVTNYCFAFDGVWESLNGAVYVQLVPASSAGVASFNGRTGAVTLTDADVTGSGLKVVTTVTSTATSTPQ